MRILFFTHPYPNYVPDFLLHGLRKLFGGDVVDYPRKDSLYQGVLEGVCREDQLCPGMFAPDDGLIDREDIRNKIYSGYYKYIICDVRAMSHLQRHVLKWPSGVVLVDGEDIPMRIPPGPYVVCRRETDGSDYSIPLPMALPEELLQWIASCDGVPKTHDIAFLGSTSHEERARMVEAIAKRYPKTLLKAMPTHSAVDPAQDCRLGRSDYYTTLQKCRIVLTLRGLGYDTLRFWENAACSAVHIAQRMPLFIPNDFEEGESILRFEGVDELIRKIDRVLEGQVAGGEIVEKGRRHLVNHHLTTSRARYLLHRLERAFA